VPVRWWLAGGGLSRDSGWRRCRCCATGCGNAGVALRAESAQTCVPWPSAGSAGSFLRPRPGASHGVWKSDSPQIDEPAGRARLHHADRRTYRSQHQGRTRPAHGGGLPAGQTPRHRNELQGGLPILPAGWTTDPTSHASASCCWMCSRPNGSWLRCACFGNRMPA
jgi:hypothetical protein